MAATRHTSIVNLDHIGTAVRDLKAARTFYGAALGAIGMKINMDVGTAFGMGSRTQKIFWLGRDPKASGSGHYAFRVDSPDEVDAFHAAALLRGGTRRSRQIAGPLTLSLSPLARGEGKRLRWCTPLSFSPSRPVSSPVSPPSPSPFSSLFLRAGTTRPWRRRVLRGSRSVFRGGCSSRGVRGPRRACGGAGREPRGCRPGGPPGRWS